MEKHVLLSPPDLSGNELSYVEQALQDNWIAPVGPHIDAFEEEFAAQVGSSHAVAVSSGTAGLHLALLAAGVSAGDVVFCSDFTFAASVNPILYQQAIPVLIDSDQTTWNLSADLLEEAFKKESKKPKAVIVAHIYGQVAELTRIKKLCDEYGAVLIEDACESLGSTYHGKHSGTIGDIGVYSFNGNKIITTSGGGMIVTNKAHLAKKMRYWSAQAKTPAPYYLHEEVGYNYRLSNILAGIGRAQLKTLASKVEKRRANFERYHEAFLENEKIQIMPMDLPGVRSNRWLTVVKIKQPAKVMEALAAKRIESRLNWNPMHRQPFLKTATFYKANEIAVSDQLFANGLCLPSGSNLTKEEQDYVIQQVKLLCDSKENE
ncbi:DegT/DnrJ/EryC1/StrS aminotransferase family protein [Listeria sp. PSOL-1]|uniref:DegT/DnrJ/EryC1/StrS family aminotransferase n=1 Tax=Listeria sp. PSOL-1 TaxID=1844999 RepID=UPI0013D0ED1F|nr:aminotransferase class V-fold PLP-dependent enzyme [Listeria sp. PSOL-1]